MRNACCFLLLVFMLLVCSGCSSVHVTYDYDNAVDFSSIRTFAWKDVQVQEDALAENPLLKKRIMTSIEAYLLSRGYTVATSEKTDVYIAIHAGMKEKMQVTNWGGRRGYYSDPWYDPWWGRGSYGGRVDVRYYTEGTLIVDIVDRIRKELIWRGLGTGLVHTYTSREKMQKSIDEYVSEILNRFPPGNETVKKAN
ncbi:MAG: DUF4136 domain-containing protein [Desulfobulbaceae bacterium]|nr:DUF4136 domain-containing protein [Desulfobulbaceae bacterium]